MSCMTFKDGSSMTEKERSEIEIREEIFVKFFAELFSVTDANVALSKGALEYLKLLNLLRRDIGRIDLIEPATSLVDYE